MITYLQHTSIDFDKWDSCIDHSINGLIYPYSFFLNQVSPGWDALVWGDYQMVMPLPVKRKLGIQYIIQPPFVQQLGVFSPQPVNEEILKNFINAIPQKFRYININLNTFNQKGNLTNLRSRTTYELDLISTYEQLKRNYSKQTIRNLKKSVQKQVFVMKNADPQTIIDTFRKNRGKDIGHWGDKQYETLKHLIYSGIHRGNTQVYSAFSSQNTFCAGIVFFKSHKKSILIFSGSTQEARDNGAMTALIDQYIKDHAGENLTLDFEGSEQKNLARFYAGFGSKECVFLQLEKNNFPFLIKPLVNLYVKHR